MGSVSLEETLVLVWNCFVFVVSARKYITVN